MTTTESEAALKLKHDRSERIVLTFVAAVVLLILGCVLYGLALLARSEPESSVRIGAVESRPKPEQIMEPPANGKWRQFQASGYAIGCTMTLSGAEPDHDITASGHRLVPNWSVATSSEFPFWTVLEISYRGIVTRRIVHDRGRMITKGTVDLAFEDCQRARSWGRRKVWIREVRRPLGVMR